VLTAAAAAAGRWLPASARPSAGAVGTLLLALAVAAPTQAWVYRTQVPDTWDLAIATAAERLRPWEGRVAYIEAPRRALAGQPREIKALLRPIEDLSTLPTGLLDRADAQLFPASRLEAGASAFHRDRTQRPAGAVTERIEPRWFVATGPAVVAIFHAREPAGRFTVEAEPLQDGWFRIDLPASAAAGWLSAELWRPRTRGVQSAPEIQLGERSLELYDRSAGRLTGWLTERFPAGAATLAAHLPATGSEQEPPALRIYAWR
jgi:hypothetical protein